MRCTANIGETRDSDFPFAYLFSVLAPHQLYFSSLYGIPCIPLNSSCPWCCVALQLVTSICLLIPITTLPPSSSSHPSEPLVITI